MILVLATLDSVYIHTPDKTPYYIMIASSALSAIVMGTSGIAMISFEDESRVQLAALFFFAGALLWGSSTTLAQFMYGERTKGLTSCAVKTGSCCMLVGAGQVQNNQVLSNSLFVLSSAGCFVSSVYDMMNVYNIANMKIRTVEVIVRDTVYDTLVVRDTVVVVKKVKTRRYRRKITAYDRQKALEEYNQGLEDYSVGKLHEALEHFRKALQYDPTFEKARSAYNRLRRQLGK